MNIKHVFFDLDHTLWDFEKNSDLTFEKLFKKYAVLVDLDAFFEVYKPINHQYWKLFSEEKITKSELQYGRLKTTFDKLNHPISDDLINQLALDYINYLPDFNHLFEGAFDVLDYLKEKYQLHVITNGFDEVQKKKMINSNIYHYFDVIVTSESVEAKKPNPKIFTHALHLANAKKEESIMIGDNYEADILGALNVGMQVIHCNFDQSENKKGVQTICSLAAIKQFL